jgi:hypothetical protein
VIRGVLWRNPMNADGAGPRVFEHAWTATLWRRQHWRGIAVIHPE